jgi:hypothetical protein
MTYRTIKAPPFKGSLTLKQAETLIARIMAPNSDRTPAAIYQENRGGRRRAHPAPAAEQSSP